MNDNETKTFTAGQLLTVTPSPHIKRPSNVRTVMIEVAAAMLPALIWGVYVFGWRSLVLTLIAVASSVFSEFLYELLMKRRITIGDFSAVVTGMLIGMNLPSSVPFWLPALGSVFAIIVVKQLFGGLGKNFLNPALAARVFLFISFPAAMSGYTTPVYSFAKYDAVASATVLAGIKGGAAPTVSVLDCFFGKTGGSIGEISALLILVGGIYLLIRGIISWRIPVAYIGVSALLFLLFPQVEGVSRVSGMLYEIFSGGLMLGAVFMATDYVTSPVTKWGRLLFGAGCGLLTFFFRVYGANAEGVSFAILIMNCLVFYIDRLTKPRIFGTGGRAK